MAWGLRSSACQIRGISAVYPVARNGHAEPNLRVSHCAARPFRGQKKDAAVPRDHDHGGECGFKPCCSGTSPQGEHTMGHAYDDVVG
eukprot:g8747.t1